MIRELRRWGWGYRGGGQRFCPKKTQQQNTFPVKTITVVFLFRGLFAMNETFKLLAYWSMVLISTASICRILTGKK